MAEQKQHGVGISKQEQACDGLLLLEAKVARHQELGLGVWRDEVGRAYAPALHGNTAAAMAAAIEMSFCVIVCVSREYYESGNCRLEACYAWGFKERGGWGASRARAGDSAFCRSADAKPGRAGRIDPRPYRQP